MRTRNCFFWRNMLGTVQSPERNGSWAVKSGQARAWQKVQVVWGLTKEASHQCVLSDWTSMWMWFQFISDLTLSLKWMTFENCHYHLLTKRPSVHRVLSWFLSKQTKMPLSNLNTKRWPIQGAATPLELGRWPGPAGFLAIHPLRHASHLGLNQLFQSSRIKNVTMEQYSAIHAVDSWLLMQNTLVRHTCFDMKPCNKSELALMPVCVCSPDSRSHCPPDIQSNLVMLLSVILSGCILEWWSPGTCILV